MELQNIVAISNCAETVIFNCAGFVNSGSLLVFEDSLEIELRFMPLVVTTVRTFIVMGAKVGLWTAWKAFAHVKEHSKFWVRGE